MRIDDIVDDIVDDIFDAVSEHGFIWKHTHAQDAVDIYSDHLDLNDKQKSRFISLVQIEIMRHNLIMIREWNESATDIVTDENINRCIALYPRFADDNEAKSITNGDIFAASACYSLGLAGVSDSPPFF